MSLNDSGVISVVAAVVSVSAVFYSSFIRLMDYCKKSSAWSIIPFQQRMVHKYRLSQSIINLVCSLPLALVIIFSKIIGLNNSDNSDSSGSFESISDLSETPDSKFSDSKLVQHLLIWMALSRPIMNSLNMLIYTIISRFFTKSTILSSSEIPISHQLPTIIKSHNAQINQQSNQVNRTKLHKK